MRVASLSTVAAMLLVGCGRSPPAAVVSPTPTAAGVSPAPHESGPIAIGEMPGPPELKKGAKVAFVVTNDHPFSGKYVDDARVEEVRGSWVLLAADYKEDDVLKTKAVWQNFNNVVWYRVVE